MSAADASPSPSDLPGQATPNTAARLADHLSALPAPGAARAEIDAWVAQLRPLVEELNEPPPGLAAAPLPELLLGESWDHWFNRVIGSNVVTPLSNSISAVNTTVGQLEKKVTDFPGEVGKKLDTLVKALPHNLAEALDHRIDGVSTEVSDRFTSLAKDLDELQQYLLWAVRMGEKIAAHRAQQAEQEVLTYLERVQAVAGGLRAAGLGEPAGEVIDRLGELVDHTKPPETLPERLGGLMLSLLEAFNPLVRIVALLVRSDGAGDFLKRLIPPMLRPGGLSEWLNGQTEYDEAHGPVTPAALQYRRELVAGFDGYFRGRLGDEGLVQALRGVDERQAEQTIKDLVNVFASTTFGFVFRPTRAPSFALPIAPAHLGVPAFPDDLAGRIAFFTSRQLAAPVKAGSGMVLRGVWEISAQNEALVEFVATLVSSTLASLVQGILHDLFWRIEIHETYASYDGDKDSLILKLKLERPPVPAGAAAPDTEYRVYLRTNVLEDIEAAALRDLIEQTPDIAQHLVGLAAQDYGAYADAVRMNRPAVPAEDALDTLEVVEKGNDGPYALVVSSRHREDVPCPPVVRLRQGYRDTTAVCLGPAWQGKTLQDGWFYGFEAKVLPKALRTLTIASDYGGMTRWTRS